MIASCPDISKLVQLDEAPSAQAVSDQPTSVSVMGPFPGSVSKVSGEGDTYSQAGPSKHPGKNVSPKTYKSSEYVTDSDEEAFAGHAPGHAPGELTHPSIYESYKFKVFDGFTHGFSQSLYLQLTLRHQSRTYSGESKQNLMGRLSFRHRPQPAMN